MTAQNSSIRSSSFRVTIAFFQSGVNPGVLVFFRRSLPETMRVAPTWMISSPPASVALSSQTKASAPSGTDTQTVIPRTNLEIDALALGEDSARSLGLALPRLRVALVALMALATGTAVAQAGLVAFVGLVAPHLVARFVRAPHGYRLVASAAMGGVLLLWADVIARSVIAPQELPVGVFTAVLGGCYLLVLLWRRGLR